MPDVAALELLPTTLEWHIDDLNRAGLRLWCRDTVRPNQPVFVDILLNERLFGRFAANEYRPDLEAAGLGSGHHALTVDFTGSPMMASDDPVCVAIYAADMPIAPFASVELRPAGTCNFDLSTAMIRHLEGHVPRLVEELCERRQQGWGLSTRSALAGGVAAPIVQPAPLSGADKRRVCISKYADFVRKRFRVEAEFKLDQASVETDNFLRWYLEFYGRLRAGLRAPLSAAEIGYLNELLVYGGQQYHLSRGTWTFILGNKSLLGSLDLNSPDSYLNIVYWWSIQRSRDLWAEDCLVPLSYVQALNEVAERWRTVNFPLSRFMEHHFSRRIDWHFLNLEYEQDRSLYYGLIMLEAQRQPTILQYLPRLWVERMLQPHAEGRSALDHLVRQVVQTEAALESVRNYKHLIVAAGFDIDRRKSTTVTTDGHRIANVGLRPEIAPAAPVSVQIIGPLQKASGLGQATRLSYDALASRFADCSAYDFDLDNPAPVGFNARRPSSPLRRAKINLIHLNAESIPLAFAFLPDVFTDAYNIGYFFWELDTPAPCHGLALELLDEIWVSSEYGVEQYLPLVDIPVTKISMSYEDCVIPPRQAARTYVHSLIACNESTFVFFAAFDSFSYIQRKNPQAVVKAFIDAFPPGSDVRLVLKTHNRDFVTDPVQRKIWQWLDEETHADPRIVIINETLPYGQLLLLKAGCDCYVSLHRSEGWGFGMIEAMHLGVAVLATGYSGNMEFCSPETAWLVRHKLCPVAPGDYIFTKPGQVWADPDHADAVRQMQAVASDTGERQLRTAQAKAFVDANFSPTIVAERYAKRLAEIDAMLARSGRPGRPGRPGRRSPNLPPDLVIVPDVVTANPPAKVRNVRTHHARRA